MSTILIAAPEHLQALKEREDFSDAQTFSDSEALRALEVITRKRPEVVALERLFAATTRGAALINRIKADPKLASCEIRIVAHDSEYSRVPARASGQRDRRRGRSTRGRGPCPRVSAARSDGAHGARPGFTIVDGVEVMVDGNAATLIDLSLVGAQVVSLTILKPNQRSASSLAEGKRPIRFSAGVAWASFELAKAGPATAPASSSSTPSPMPFRSSATPRRNSRNLHRDKPRRHEGTEESQS